MVKDLSLPIAIEVLPIVREHDGLALSSRNKYLSKSQRQDAVVLYRALQLAKTVLKKKKYNSKMIISQMRNLIKKTKSAKIDYVAIVNPRTLESIKIIQTEALILLAVYIGKTRLIDNMIIRRK